MGRGGWLAVGVLILLVMAVATLPAALLLQRINTPIPVQSVQGTVWSGQAIIQPPMQSPLTLLWQWQGADQWHWQLSDEETQLQGLWRAREQQSLTRVQGSVALRRVDVLNALGLVRPTGQVVVDLDRLAWSRQAVPQVQGQLLWQDAGLRGVVQAALGEVAVVFSAGASQQAIVRSLRPADVMVDGMIELSAQDYAVDVWLSAEGYPGLQRQLAQLGTVAADGRVRIELAGPLWW